jgi:PKD repeat protein
MNDTLCVGGNAILRTNAKGVGLEYQWQISTNGTTFTNIADNATYNGSQTKDLTIQNVKKIFQNYDYQCIITNDCGEILTTMKVKIFIDSLPKVDFSIAVVGNQIICTNKSVGGNSFLWDFGDGQDSDFKNPVHLYTNDGEFTVELAVSNQCGVAFYSQLITIVTPPTASFNAISPNGCAPLAVSFENKSSKNVTSYKWTFEGGSPSTSTDQNPTITYLKSGIYGVTLEVINSKFKDISTQTALVNISEKPNTNFTYQAGQNANIIFTNTSTNNPVTYRWDFGDGTFSVDKDITHDFVKDSTFRVTLTSTNGCGSTSIVKEIKIETRPKAAFVSNTQKGCLPLNVKFFSSASSNTTQWNWYFPGADKDTSSLPNPIVKYTKSGTYDVYLSVKNASGKDSIAQKSYIVVGDKPSVDFNFVIDRLNVTFENKSKDYKSITWDFNDKAVTSNEEKPTHLFSKSGLYKVILKATNDCGTTSVTKEINVTNRVDCDDIVATIAPNPVLDYALLKFNAGRNVKLPYILTSIDGKVLERGELAEDILQFEFDLTTFASGIYILYLKCDNRILTQRILKIMY